MRVIVVCSLFFTPPPPPPNQSFEALEPTLVQLVLLLLHVLVSDEIYQRGSRRTTLLVIKSEMRQAILSSCLTNPLKVDLLGLILAINSITVVIMYGCQRRSRLVSAVYLIDRHRQDQSFCYTLVCPRFCSEQIQPPLPRHLGRGGDDGTEEWRETGGGDGGGEATGEKLSTSIKYTFQWYPH